MDPRTDIVNPFGGRVWHKTETGSTMIDAEDLVRGLPPAEAAGSLVWASYQSRGQGRFVTRRWEAGTDESLTFTLIVPPLLAKPGDGGFAPSLRLGLGLALWLESLGLAPRIKWPNDLLVQERKLCGILVSGYRGHYLAGIGLNVNQLGFDQDLRRPATSLRLCGLSLPTAPREATAWALAGLLPWLERGLGMAAPGKQLDSRLWHRGQHTSVTPSPGAVAIEGTIQGVDESGALLLQSAEGLRRVVSGE